MKRNKFGLYLTGFICWVSLALLFLISNFDSQVDGIYILTLKHKDFTANDITKLEETGYYVTYANTYQGEARTKLKEESAVIVETNENYGSFNNGEIVSGAFFNGVQVEKGYSVAVLSTLAAWDFFGTENCVGNQLVINEKPYEVVGVLEKRQEQEKEVYIPALDKKNPIEQLTVKLDNSGEMQPLINTLGYAAKDVEVTDLNNVKERISQRPKLIVFLWGLYFIKILFGKSNIRLKKIRQMGKEFIADNYVQDVGKRLLLNPLFLKEIVGTVFNMILIYFVLIGTTFKPALPSNFFSAKSLDYEVLTQMLHFFVSVDSVPKYIKDINMISNLFFTISIISSVLFIHYVNKMMNQQNIKFNLIDKFKRSQYTK